MQIIWTDTASDELDNNLLFWLNKNKSELYPNKILDEVEKVEKQLKENPLFLSHYVESLNLFQRIFFKGKFSIFYEVYEKDSLIVIHRFRSNKQEPL